MARWPIRTLEERLFEKFNITDGCWLWTAYRNKCGYGVIGTSGGKSALAHRVMYSLKVGEIPYGMEVCHKCDIPACVNPAHLFLGTHRENMEDSAKKGRARALKGSANKNSRLTEADAEYILNSKERAVVLAQRFGVSNQAIGLIRRGKKWKHVPSENTGSALWDVAGENHHMAKLTEEQVATIISRYRALKVNGRCPAGTVRALAAEFGVHENYPSMLSRGICWKSL